MSVNEMLSTLTSSDDDRAEKFDEKLARKLREITPLLTDEIREKTSSERIRTQYLKTLAWVLHAIKQLNAEDVDAPFSMNQYCSLKIAVELMISIGIVPCLQCGVGVDMAKLCPRALEIPQEDLSCKEKYERLKFVTSELMNLFDDQLLRQSILLHFGTIMAALLQLSYAPLAKPTNESKQIPENVNKHQFHMTVETYKILQHEQEQFHAKFISLLSNCPQYMCIRELMVIHGKQYAPKWVRRRTRSLLIDKITQPGGVQSLITAICEDSLDIGKDWNKLDTISRLLATSHGGNADEYYRTVCPQILDLLSSNEVEHGSTIANCCIAALYDYNPSACHKHIVEVISAPLIMTESSAVRTEEEVEQCIQTLAKCFLAEDAKFKRPSCKLILHIATPLFSLYSTAYQNPCLLKKPLEQLILKLLEEEATREELYSAFLGHDMSMKFGNYVSSEFRVTGIKITGLSEDLRFEELADTVLNLVSIAKYLSPSIFSYTLKFLSNVNKPNCNERTEQRELLETEDDKIGRICKMQEAGYKLLSLLATEYTIQDAQARNPKPLLSFIKVLFDKYNEKIQDKTEDNECEILYLSLMLIKMILIEKRDTLEIDLFRNFSLFLKRSSGTREARSKMPEHLKSMINEVVSCVETHGRSERTNHQDFSTNSISSGEFNKAIKDLVDPLLPVRGHGLITLTKLIESRDPCVVASKEIVLHLFKENLKHEDSFIYLASINGLCALATAFPVVAIETLLQEYINMPNHVASTEITIETRIKVGEILVKTTKALGEMSAYYKNMLVNGFLCVVRDADPLVRASSLSCLGELCKVLGFRLGNILTEILYCITCIVNHDKAPECRRAAVLVASLLFRGLDKDTLSSINNDLVGLYRGLKHLYNNDDDPVLRLHAQLALEEIDQIVKEFLFTPPKLEKTFVLDQLS